MNINLNITNIRNIRYADIELPFESGLYAIVGENGCGKSTIMLALSLAVKTSSSHLLSPMDLNQNSQIHIQVGEREDSWIPNKAQRLSTGKYDKNGRLYSTVHYHGFYEGSIFYGSRFNDYNQIDNFLNKSYAQDRLIDADEFVVKSLGFILHNNEAYYTSLKVIATKAIASEEGLKGRPYFLEKNGYIISQYKMSSGESMLISLIDFVNNLIIKGSYEKLLFLIDEVELALHPGAVDRLVIFFEGLIKKRKPELIIYFSTHSTELIHRIDPENIYLVENNEGNVKLTHPCYPNYAVRHLYIPNGFDFIILVEDILAKSFIERVIQEHSLSTSKLICILLAGGYPQIIQLHSDMITYNTLGKGKMIISVFDGDVKNSVEGIAVAKNLPKCYLPISSIEKYLLKKCISERDGSFIKRINDSCFNVRSLNSILDDYNGDERTRMSKKKDGKGLYKVIKAVLLEDGCSIDKFVNCLCEDILTHEDISGFVKNIEKLLK